MQQAFYLEGVHAVVWDPNQAKAVDHRALLTHFVHVLRYAEQPLVNVLPATLDLAAADKADWAVALVRQNEGTVAAGIQLVCGRPGGSGLAALACGGVKRGGSGGVWARYMR